MAASSLAAGRRDRKVVFQRDTGTDTNDMNEHVEDWTDYATEWAAVNFGTGQERRTAGQEAGSAPATFKVLANSKTNALKTRDRINFDGSIWDITSNVPSVEFNAGRDITAVRAT